MRMRQLSEGFKRKFEEGEVLVRHRKKRRMTFDWSELPQDVLVRIVEDFTVSFLEFTNFSCVCRAWHDATMACNLVKMKDKWSHHDQMPLMMLTELNNEVLTDNDVEVEYSHGESVDGGGDGNDVEEECIEKAKTGQEQPCIRKFWDIRSNKYYNICCPRGYEKVCWGSPYGWIVTVDLGHKIYMFNPLTNSRCSLPSRRTFPRPWRSEDHEVVRKYFINKAVILKVPKGTIAHGGCNNDDTEKALIVVAMYGYVWNHEGQGHVAIANCGDLKWTGLKWSHSSDNDIPDLEDVTYHKDLGLVFVCKRGGVVYCNLWDEEQPLSLKWYVPRVNDFCNQMAIPYLYWARYQAYIANYKDVFYMVWRLVIPDGMNKTKARDYYQTCRIRVYKLDWQARAWRHVRALQEDVAIFVGDNTTMVVCAHEAGCEGNTVYCADDSRRYFCCRVKAGDFTSIPDVNRVGTAAHTAYTLKWSCVQSTKERIGGFDAGVCNFNRELPTHWRSLCESRLSSRFWFRPSL